MAGVNSMNRRSMLKMGATGAAAAGLGLAIPALVSVPAAGDEGSHRRGRRVHIHGVVTNPDPEVGSVLLSVTVDGRKRDLSGSGWDTGLDPKNVSGACYFTQAGSVRHDKVKLQGTVLFANDPTNSAAAVTTDADLDTGDITFNFAGFVFTGTGIVVRD